MKEIWANIDGYERYYQVSNLGNVRSKTGKILKPQQNSKGYLRVQFKVNGIAKRFFVHRLVANVFCIKEDGNDIVNHLDFDYTNNKASNLEWTTLKGNSQYSLKHGRSDRTKEWLDNQRKSLQKYDKPVIGTNIESGEKVYFPTINEAGRNFNNRAGDICRCCKGIRQMAQGYKWEYDTDNREGAK